MALLNVAVIIPVFGQSPDEASSGVTETTAGGVRGATGLPAPEFLSGSLHPTTKTDSRNAKTQKLLTFNLRIRFSS
jgi:hypothetical protein